MGRRWRERPFFYSVLLFAAHRMDGSRDVFVQQPCGVENDRLRVNQPPLFLFQESGFYMWETD